MRNRIFLSLLFLLVFTVHAGQLPLPTPEATLSPEALKSYGQLPLSFERNQGQSDKMVKFLSRGPGYTLFLTPSEAVLSLKKPNPKLADKLNPIKQAKFAPPLSKGESFKSPATLSLRMRLVGANLEHNIEGVDELPGKVNYLKGKDPKQWHTGVSTYGKVRYQGVYPGIDLVYYGKQQKLEYDFIVQPGADSKRIRLDFSGVDGARIDSAGDLLLKTKDGELRLQKPVLYQTIDGKKHDVEGNFVLHKPGQGEGKKKSLQIGFQVASYDPSQSLVIDPVLEYSTYFGGNFVDYAYGIAVDKTGNAYVTGFTSSPDFPTANALYPNLGEELSDAFIFKLSGDGQSVAYSTYLGGSDYDGAGDIAVDGEGSAYITGTTSSSDFPTLNAKYSNLKGPNDAFVLKLSNGGQSIGYSTFLGGSDVESGQSIAVDSAGNAYITGRTYSSDFPTVNALYPIFGGINDGFIFKLSGDGQSVEYSTYLGGSGDDFGLGIAVDGAGNTYVAGDTQSSNFPVVNALYPIFGGGSDAFIFKLSGDGQSVAYSTFLGGSNSDGAGGGIAVDDAGNAYVTGSTYSPDFPTVNALYPNFGGGISDAFLVKLRGDGQSIGYSTFLGGSNHDSGWGIAVDDAGNAYVTGSTFSPDFPTVNALYPNFGGIGTGENDAFVLKLSNDGQSIGYSTFLGGSYNDNGSSIDVDSAGNAYVTGWTQSSDFPVVNAKYPTLSTPWVMDAFITKLSSISSLTLRSPNGGEIWNGGSKQTISWISQNIDSGKRLRLYLSTDNGLNWKKIGGAANEAGFKTWKIPKKRYFSKQALIKICLKQNIPLCDTSDAVFTINQQPVAKAGTRQTAIVGKEVTLYGGASYDPDNSPLGITYKWVQLRGPSIVLIGADGITANFAATEPGTYVFGLTVNDGSEDSRMDKVKVKITAPQ